MKKKKISDHCSSISKGMLQLSRLPCSVFRTLPLRVCSYLLMRIPIRKKAHVMLLDTTTTYHPRTLVYLFIKNLHIPMHLSFQPWNFLPSISEATGRLSPQRYVWRIFIALHATPRLAIAAGYYKMHCGIFGGNAMVSIYLHLTKAAYILHVTEILSLVGLSFISSTEDYGMHVNL